MKREEKNDLTRRRILDAAMAEFAAKGYGAASLNAVCGAQGLSKGIIYHYFRDKDALYLTCVGACFQTLTGYLEARLRAASAEASAETRLRDYFDARLRFFEEHPTELGLFLSAVLSPPAHLAAELAEARGAFDALNVSTLTELLLGAPLRPGLSLSAVVEDFRLYMDYFNTRLRAAPDGGQTPREALEAREERCRRQIDILLHGVLEDAHEGA